MICSLVPSEVPCGDVAAQWPGGSRPMLSSIVNPPKVVLGTTRAQRYGWGRTQSLLRVAGLVVAQQGAGEFSSGVREIGRLHNPGRLATVGQDQADSAPDRLNQQGPEPH